MRRQQQPTPQRNAHGLRQSRRWFLRAAGTAALASAGLTVPTPAGAKQLLLARDYATLSTFTWAEGQLYDYNPSANNEHSVISFANSLYLKTYMLMYHTFGNTVYLDKFFAAADEILLQRDDKRGVRDYLGRILPLWRKGYLENTGAGEFSRGSTKLVRLRIGQRDAYGANATISIAPGTLAGHFTITSKFKTLQDTFANVNLDPASSNYVVSRLYWDSPNTTRTTAIDLRTGSINPADVPDTISAALTTEFSHHFIDVGLITSPMADFAATVRSTPALQQKYGAMADIYLQAAVDAVNAKEDRWVETATEAWYQSDPEAPGVYAGSESPHNHNLAIALVYIHLANATGSSIYRSRATKLLTRFKNDLRLSIDTTFYVWNYFNKQSWGYKGWARTDHVSTRIPFAPDYQQFEDVRHAVVEMEAVVTAYQNGIVITAQDLERFGTTFTNKLQHSTGVSWTNNEFVYYDECSSPGATHCMPTTHYMVNGLGDPGVANYATAGWCGLAPWKSGVFDYTRNLYNTWKYGEQFDPDIPAIRIRVPVLHGIAQLVAANAP